MPRIGNLWKTLACALLGDPAPSERRRPRRAELAWDCLEDRKVLSHFGGFHRPHHGPMTGTGTTGGGSTNSALTTALQTLHNDVVTIEIASSTTVGELAAVRSSLRTVANDGLTPSSNSALSNFENTLVTDFASGMTLTGNATLLGQFEAIYTAAPTTQRTTGLTAAYNALAAAVTSSNITAANIMTIKTDYSAVLAAQNSTSTATFPYFSLVTGNGGPGGGMRGGCH